ncbi:leucine-rich repeat-containing protein 34 isoform X1 [Strongylocentrotus purpuratus]|uniref:Leucine-rich repeat-containing protein 34 n=1 Tax=Strongylocentrotus purpuratus TaxID=7668 RepID=A0A7M7P282_STRPU|nr:leucine-rich repeat-containing protein 34 isoform X1 [Strongylocentrotus purpuratus]
MDPAAVQTRYEDVCMELEVKPNPYIMKVLDKERDEQIMWELTENDPKDFMDMEMPGNNHLLTDKMLQDEDAYVLLKVLANNTYVTGLDMRYNQITDKGAEHIAELLKETCALKRLSLMCNDLGPEGGAIIANGLQLNETLQELKLNGNKIGNKGGMALAGVLQVNTALQSLDLGDTDQDTQSMIAFTTVLNYNSTLKALCMNRPLLFSQQEETTIHFAKMLKVNSTLTELHLQKCDIKDTGAERLSEMLVENIGLKYLDLACNKIRRDGAKYLSRVLMKNTPLEVLDLGHNCIEDDGAMDLSRALTDMNTNLHTLVITSNNIKAPGLCAIASAMENNPNFNSVFIWGNHHEEDACNAFHRLIEGGNLEPEKTDVKPYVVDGQVYLSELSHGLRRQYYWTPFYGPDVKNDKKI